MPSPATSSSSSISPPEFSFSEEARQFLLAATYARDRPRADDKSRMPLVLWTLRTGEISPDGSTVADFGPRYQLFVCPVVDITSELVAELNVGEPIAFRLDPTLKRASSYFVSLDHDRLTVQPG